MAKQQESNKSDLANEDDAYDAIFGGEFGSLEIGSYIGANKTTNTKDYTEHLPDAVDFEDEDELADDDDDLPEEMDIGPHSSMMDMGVYDNNENSAVMRMDSNSLNLQLPEIGGDVSREFILEGDGSVPATTNALFMGMDANEIHLATEAGVLDAGSGHEIAHSQLSLNEVNADNMPMNSRFTMEPQEYQMSDNKHKKPTKLDLINHEKYLLKKYFPDFEKGKILKWNKLIYRRYASYHWHRDVSRVKKPFMPLNLKFRVQQDDKRLFNSKTTSYLSSIYQGKNNLYQDSSSTSRRGLIHVSVDELFPVKEQQKKRKIIHDEKTISEDLLIATDDWDQEKIIDQEATPPLTEPSITSNLNSSGGYKLKNLIEDVAEDWHWDEDMIIDANLKESKHAELNMNDEKLLLMVENTDNLVQQKQQLDSHNLILPINETTLQQKLNLSNDDKYQILKKTHQTKVRSTISNLNIQHSQPAINLQSPFYKVAVPRYQLRHFHRENFGSHIRPGTKIVFSKLKARKRKRDKGKDVKESFSTSQDLTIGDTAPVYLMEYSEQTPVALSKFGMANKLINYYRKANEQDTLRPKLPVGETHVLGVQDKSPFWNFGFVEPGHIVPTLYNNMVRAPVFKHDISGTDFLLIRSSGFGISNRFYLRNINHLFTVGQTFPVEEIPGPNSRKVTSMKATRLKMIIYRILNHNHSKAISIDPIAKHFPDQDYGQNRQKVKEFMKYQRDGPEKGLWRLKDDEKLLDNEAVKNLITPEQISQVESMNQGLQFQEDNESYNFDSKLKSLEENLLLWNITKNFINSTQMRAMIQIHGVGDPTGCGEGFSFLKTSMKGGFVKSGSPSGNNNASNKKGTNTHSYNVAQQQRAYDEEIAKTWYTHTKSLSISNPFEEMNNPDEINQTNKHVKTERDDKKILKIVRKKRDENGIIQRQTIFIRDPRVIQGYVKIKEQDKEDVNKLLEEDTSKINNLEELEKQKKLLQLELANLEKSQQRRAARQNSKKNSGATKMEGAMDNGSESSSAIDGKITKNKSKNTTRRCATCGQIGHIRTNKSCPMYSSRDDPISPK
ncbi:hypothetical protein N7582_002413 [Saccharomyces uvarum]|uniref:Transcription initiation factor TFIID subunit 1 n=1 Tax=Saccharomyces uvarum TaxID=230603 RepID=A0AA35NU54_SACUV|nr:hypothetical protein N7582_002413 [Saccharomyces uvarum]CAI4063442.1 hypothetical protein SUVC_07G4950 [Saccharomyces uvarum]